MILYQLLVQLILNVFLYFFFQWIIFIEMFIYKP